MFASIELEKIEPNPWQPRKNFVEADLLELGESIKTEGLKQSIGLRPHPSKKGMFQIIWGERRVRASRMVGLQTIKAEIMNATDRDMKKWTVLENSSRYTNPIENARSTKMLRNAGMSFDRIAKSVGRRKHDLQKEIALLNLPHELQEKVAKGEIPKKLGIAIGELPQHLHMEAYKVTQGRLLKWQMDRVYAMGMKSKNITLLELTDKEKEMVQNVRKKWEKFKKLGYEILSMTDNKPNLMAEVAKDLHHVYFIKVMGKGLKILGDIVSKRNHLRNLKGIKQE